VDADAVIEAGVVGLAAQVGAGRTAARDALEVYLDRIARHGAALNAFLAVAADPARAAAEALDRRRRDGAPLGPLAGVPLAIKDNLDVAGLATTAGIGALRGRTPERDAACVASLRRADAVLLGKTNMDEAAFGATNDNPHFGRCHNPHRPDCTPGGSSGGSAAAVAAGLAAAALGSDTLGSVRIPAAYCGCVGYKPTRGSVPAGGLMPLCRSLDEVGVLARSVADCAAVFDAIRDRVPGAASAPPSGLTGVGIGMVAGLDVEPEIAAAADRTAAALAACGCTLNRCALEAVDLGRVRRAGLLVTEAEGARVHADLLADPKSGISQALRDGLGYGAAQTPERLAQARELLRDASRRVDSLLASFALLVLPTTPQPAFPFGSPVPANQAELTVLASAGGLPAISIPAGWSREGLPVGVQLIGARGSDALVLAAGAACERALGAFPPAMLRA
jgi:aspartyl-tRNA(Asn)/glutamyl-tRNA(Gln) amidotransferase subunit A